MRKTMNNMGFLSGVTAVIMTVSLIGGLSHTNDNIAAEVPVSPEEVIETPFEVIEENQLKEMEDLEVEEDVPEAINGLLIGFDRTNGLTDVIMVGHIDPENNTVQIISIPRDLEIYFTEDEFKAIKKNNPKNRILHAKLNNIYSLIGWDETALMDIKAIAEVITDLEIDYMMTINIDGFKDMVDAVGGVEFDVPQDMYYNDPAQDLYIDLDKGLQVLDGDKAEQLVRYRKGYERGDLQRIEVQQEFVAAMVDQVIHRSDFNKISQLLTTSYNMIDTDFGLVVMLEYAEFFFNLELEHVLAEENMITIPSWGEKVEGLWFQYFDLEEARAAVDNMLNDADEEGTEDGR